MPKKPEKQQTAVLIDEKLVNSSVLSPATLASLQANEKEVFCATCEQPLQLILSEAGPVGIHEEAPLHLPEDIIIRKGKELLEERLADMFPLAQVGRDVSSVDPEGFLDFAVVLSNGGKIGVRFLPEGSEIAESEWQTAEAAWTKAAVKILWILDWRRLKIPAARNRGNSTVSVSIGKTESQMIKRGIPLIYLDIENRQLIKVLVPSPAAILVKENQVKRLGKLKCFLQRYRIGQLRINQGEWNLKSEFDSRPPKPPALPKRLQTKWQDYKSENRA